MSQGFQTNLHQTERKWFIYLSQLLLFRIKQSSMRAKYQPKLILLLKDIANYSQSKFPFRKASYLRILRRVKIFSLKIEVISQRLWIHSRLEILVKTNGLAMNFSLWLCRNDLNIFRIKLSKKRVMKKANRCLNLNGVSILIMKSLLLLLL